MTPRTRVKICGISDPVAFDTAISADADWIGFVFFPPSPRYVTPARAASLSARSPGGVPRVGLFVDPTLDAIAATLDAVRLDILQIYGGIDPAVLKVRFGLPVWRAVGVAGKTDLPKSCENADRLVMEAKPPPDSARPGGNAARFDWSLLRGWDAPLPWILAGGLTVDNVAEAIRATGAAAVDVSSGIERAPGVKDPALIRAFIRNARSSDVRFRRAAAADATAIGSLHVQCWREAYAGLMPQEILAGLDPAERAAMWRDELMRGAAIWLAEWEGTTVGFGASGPQSDRSLPYPAEIRALYVLQHAQHRGIGRGLMAAMARDLLEQGHSGAALWVLEGNAPARRFYATLGGQVVARECQQREGFTAVGVAYGWRDLRTLIEGA